MIRSYQNHSWLLSTRPYVFLILLLHLLHSTGIDGSARFTIVNRCSQPIWPVVQNRGTLEIAEYELPIGSSIAFQRPNGWFGRLWGKTGCIFNEAGKATCATGDCGPQNQCNNTNTNPSAITMAEFSLGTNGSSISMDLYDVSLVDGYNLPLLLEPSGEGAGSSGSCRSTGCVEDSLNQMCPPELRTAGGAGCLSPCAVFGSPEYCCSTGGQQLSCGPTNYSQVFKKACPLAYSYPLDDVNTTFACGTAADYSLTFCPPYDSLLVPGMPPALAPSPAYPPQSFYNDPQERKGNNRAKQIITIVSGCISGVIVVSVIICCFLKRRNSHKLKCNQDVENLLLQHGSLAPKRYRYSEIRKITKSLREKLGRGGYGSVYKGMLPDGRLVAVKILIETESNGEEFINEVVSISRTYHVNIVTLLGFCYEGNKRALVYEFMPNKSLDKFLNNKMSTESGGPFLDLNKLFEIAVGIAKGLEYLHTGCITRIVHFDIKPQNILLDQDLCPKISDFGLAKLCKKKHSILSVLGTRGTIGYIAPEVFSRNFGGVSHKSDVYSYGMMLLEMAGAKEIVENGALQSSENSVPDEIYELVISDVANNVDDLTIQGEEETRRKLFMVGFWCIQTIPSDRPSISKVVEMLEGNLSSIQIPPKPFLFPPVINPADQETSPSFSEPVEMENLAQD